MHFVEILGSKSKQQNSKNFNEVALIFRHSVYHLFYFYLNCGMVQDFEVRNKEN